MTDNIKVFREFDQLVRNQYGSIPLQHLGDVKIENKNPASFFVNVIRSKEILKPFENSDFKFFDEVHFISKDVKYLTALLFYLRPHITDSSSGTYYQNIEDRRYMMYASIGYQSIYNYWDRIGDLLDKFFITGLPHSSIYFSRVLHNFPKEFKESENYKWLNDTYTTEIKNFLIQRDDIVHSYQLECQYYWRVIDANMDVHKTSEIQKEKESFPEEFKKQLELVILGFEKALRLINELPDKE